MGMESQEVKRDGWMRGEDSECSNGNMPRKEMKLPSTDNSDECQSIMRRHLEDQFNNDW